MNVSFLQMFIFAMTIERVVLIVVASNLFVQPDCAR